MPASVDLDYGKILTDDAEVKAKGMIQKKVETMLAEEYNPALAKQTLINNLDSDPTLTGMIIERGWKDYFSDIQSRWTNMALVSALIVTMIKLDPMEALDAEDFLSDYRPLLAKAHSLLMVVSFTMGVSSIICSTLLLIWSTEFVTNVEDLLWFCSSYGSTLWWAFPQACWWLFLVGKLLSILLLHEGVDGVVYFGIGALPMLVFYQYTKYSEQNRRAHRSKKLEAFKHIMIAAVKDAEIP